MLVTWSKISIKYTFLKFPIIALFLDVYNRRRYGEALVF
jgi:hypothetical protein